MQQLAAASVAINRALSDRPDAPDDHRHVAREVIESHQAITLFIDPRRPAPRQRRRSTASYSDEYAEWRNQPLQLEPIAETAGVPSSYTATRLTEAGAARPRRLGDRPRAADPADPRRHAGGAS
jgi:hypothetical protein